MSGVVMNDFRRLSTGKTIFLKTIFMQRGNLNLFFPPHNLFLDHPAITEKTDDDENNHKEEIGHDRSFFKG